MAAHYCIELVKHISCAGEKSSCWSQQDTPPGMRQHSGVAFRELTSATALLPYKTKAAEGNDTAIVA